MMDKSKIKKILLVAPNWIGDAVMALPAISLIREDFPSARITILGLPHISQLFQESPLVDEILKYNDRSKKMGLLTTVREIQQCKFNMAILFPNSFKTAMIVRLAGVPLRAGYNRDGRGFLLNMPVIFNSRAKRSHQVECYIHLVTVLSGISEGHFPHFPEENVGSVPPYGAKSLHLSKDELQEARNTLSMNHVTPDDLIIGMNPGAAYGSSKRWHPERFGLVARALTTQYNARVIVFGGNAEADIAKEVTEKAGIPLINMAGRTSVRELMALIAHCRLFITNDSGPMHIATALAVPVVAIFGSTDPLLTGPAGSGHVVIKKEVPCSPCFKRQCPTDLKCMDLVNVDDVLEGVEKILK